ncbi:MAG: alpha/beta fold hydrolase [Candidatus Dormibacteraceae bacterium]
MLAPIERGAGPAVTFLHGFTQRATSWSEVWGLLPGGRRLVAVDLPGHGDSSDAGATLPEAAAALAATWDRLGIERSDLVGYSLGGRLALWVAATLPGRVTRLVTIGAHAGFEGPARDRRLVSDEALARRIEAEGVERFATYWAGLPLFSGLRQRGPERLAELDRMRRQNRASGLAASLRGMGGAATPPFWDRLPAASAPALLLAGERDEPYVEHAQRLRSQIPGARVGLVPGAGHPAHLEQPQRVAALLARALERPAT